LVLLALLQLVLLVLLLGCCRRLHPTILLLRLLLLLLCHQEVYVSLASCCSEPQRLLRLRCQAVEPTRQTVS
jgi:hypothetical protein